MEYNFQTVYHDPEFLTEAGFGKVAHLPCIYDLHLRYHRLGSQFLIDRGLGVWDPRNRGSIVLPIPPSSKSMKNYADRLCNFLEWCDIRGLDPLTIQYQSDLIGRYQKEMLKGIWSRDNKPLAERTINCRVEVASDFLTWLSDKGMRDPFVVPKITKLFIASNSKSSVGHLSKEIEVRQGKLRESKRRLGFPENADIAAWLKRLYEKEGVGLTEGLIAELFLETAVRREEAACWRVDTLPLNPAHWRIVNPQATVEHQAVLVVLRYGTKGKEFGRDHGDKIGPVGTIRVPMPLALKLHSYREKVRPKALDVAIRKGRGLVEQKKIKDDAVQLFLNPLTGRRYTGDNIYDFWRSVDRPQGWSPHLARDFWACTLLWMRLEQHRNILEQAINTQIDEVAIEALKTNVLSIVQLEIQPQLRHVSTETTMIYLQWVSDRLGMNLNLLEKWAEELAESDDLDEEEA